MRVHMNGNGVQPVQQNLTIKAAHHRQSAEPILQTVGSHFTLDWRQATSAHISAKLSLSYVICRGQCGRDQATPWQNAMPLQSHPRQHSVSRSTEYDVFVVVFAL